MPVRGARQALSHAKEGLPRLESSVRCPAQRHQVHTSPQAEAAAANMKANIMASSGVRRCNPQLPQQLHADPLVAIPGHNIEQATDKGVDPWRSGHMQTCAS